MSEEIKKNGNTFDVINFSRVELPTLTENTAKGIVEFGKDNLYPNELIEFLNTSAVHNAVVIAKSLAIVGEGAKITGNVTTETEALFNAWLEEPNADEDFEDLVNKVALDFETFGAFALEIVWQKNGTKIAEINHFDCSKIRIEPTYVDGKIVAYQYSRDWKNARKANNVPVRIAAFNPETAKADGRQLLYVKNYRAGNEFYGIPNYIAALSWISLDAKLGLFHLSNIENGMNPSMHIALRNGIPTEEEQLKFHTAVKNGLAGASNTGKFFITHSDGKDTETEVKPIPASTIDNIFVVLNDLIIQNILTAHRVTSPMLMGVKTEGQLGGASEIDSAYSIFDKTVIAPSRKVIEKTFNKLLKYIIAGAKLQLVPSNPVEFRLSESVLAQIMTVKELRAKVDLPDLTPEELSTLKLSVVTCNCGKNLNQCNCTQKLNNAA